MVFYYQGSSPLGYFQLKRERSLSPRLRSALLLIYFFIVVRWNYCSMYSERYNLFPTLVNSPSFSF